MTIYDKPEYWNGDIGYRPPGYRDFGINLVKEACIQLRHPDSVLDVGCAYGYSVNIIFKLGIPAIGMDISRYARKQSPNKHLVFYGDVSRKINLKDKNIDLVFSSGMLEHIPKEKMLDAISEMVRVGKRGLIGVSCSDDPSTREGADDSHEVVMTRGNWQKLFPPEFKIISDSFEGWMRELIDSMREENNTFLRSVKC